MNGEISDSKKAWRSINIAVLLIFLLIFILFIMAEKQSDETSSSAKNLEQITIVGEYSADGGLSWSSLENGGYNQAENLIIRGYFSRNIDNYLIVRFDNVCARLNINGEQIFSHGYNNNSYSNAPGIDIAFYDLSGITTEDFIYIEIYNPYYNNYHDTFYDTYYNFLENLKTGNGYGVFSETIKEEWFFILSGIFVIGIGIICFISAVICQFLKKSKQLSVKVVNVERLYNFSFFALASGYYSLIDSLYTIMPLFIDNNLLCNILDAMSVLFINIASILFCYTIFMDNKIKKGCYIVAFIFGLLTITVLMLQIFGVADLFQMLYPVYIASDIAIGYLVAGLLIEIFKNHNKEAKTVLILFTPIIFAALLEFINYYFPFMPKRINLKVGILITILLQFYWLIALIKKHVDSLLQTVKLQNDLMQSRINVMLSQMQPHFLYNVLGIIKALCTIDSEAAGKATGEFADYLRANMDSLTSDHLITFDKELDYVQNYLELEKLRYKDRLTVEWDIRCNDFSLPAASLQILVENAIKHGIAPKAVGGTITIKSNETVDGYEISVTDDGVGFEPDKTANGEHTHIGLFNAENRISKICGGRLQISSTKDKGTQAKISLPRGVVK